MTTTRRMVEPIDKSIFISSTGKPCECVPIRKPSSDLWVEHQHVLWHAAQRAQRSTSEHPDA